MSASSLRATAARADCVLDEFAPRALAPKREPRQLWRALTQHIGRGLERSGTPHFCSAAREESRTSVRRASRCHGTPRHRVATKTSDHTVDHWGCFIWAKPLRTSTLI
jgi:hypothetical protein